MDGTTTKLWIEYWIPQPTTFRVITHLNTILLDAIVSTLIGGPNRLWN